ncbi:MAG TPA: hypothetical protein VGY54_00625 [Polyangiaceae bacterium]|jgi:hypothetical protein|nr:hypothetical protein [Polyangiaceae bacterium]
MKLGLIEYEGAGSYTVIRIDLNERAMTFTHGLPLGGSRAGYYILWCWLASERRSAMATLALQQLPAGLFGGEAAANGNARVETE